MLGHREAPLNRHLERHLDQDELGVFPALHSPSRAREDCLRPTSARRAVPIAHSIVGSID